MKSLVLRRQKPSVRDLIQTSTLLIESGQYASAIDILNQAVGLDPLSTAALSNLGAAHMLNGDRDKAEVAFDKALNIDPQHWPTLINAAHIKLEKRQTPDVIAAFQNVVSWSGAPVEAFLLYARGLIDIGQFSTAHRLLIHHRRQLSKEPEFWLLFGVANQFIGLPLEAVAAMRNHLSLGPAQTEITSRYARLVADCGDYGQARNILSRQVSTGRSPSETRVAYARVQEILGDRETPAKIYEDILTTAPNHSEALTNLGNLSKISGDYCRAEHHYLRALQIHETSAMLHYNLSDILGKSFRLAEAITELERCVKLNPENPYHLSYLLFAQHYLAGITGQKFKEASRTWGVRHGSNERSPSVHRNVSRDGPLSIGLISGSFCQHPVSFLALAGLEKLNRSEFSITCYANQAGGDGYTKRFQDLSDRWRPIAHLDDNHLTSLVREDQIDILIEMSGHAAGHRLPVIARRVAPLQIKWIGGQFNTMGIDAIDYFLSDPIESPASHDADYFERIYRLPDVYACYEPPGDAPDISKLPALKNGHITFGSLNKVNKISPETIDLWSNCLKAIPESRLILQSEPFDDQSNIDRAQALFAKHGIEASRIKCVGFTPHPDLFLTYHQIDIALDPHPYSGCLTTCESLWMGVPVVTLPGPTFAGRHSASFLTAVGLKDWIAENEDDYVKIVSEKCADLKALGDLRQNLRQKMARSPLCNSDQFAAHLGIALKEMWSETVARQKKAA